MGNVFALTPSPEQLTSGVTSSNFSKETEENDSNPGRMEDLHRKCKEIFPVNFEGAKLMINKRLSSHFQISHTLNMSSVSPSGYKFGTIYVGTKQNSPTEAYPILLGDADLSGNLNANIIHQFGSNVRAKLAAQIQDSKYMLSQLTTDYKGQDFTTSLTLGNIDVQNASGVAVFHYLQTVTSNLILGAEMLYQYGPLVPGKETSLLSLAGRYTSSNYVWSGTLSTNAVNACYYHKGSEHLQIGIEVGSNFKTGESVTSLGYMLEIPKADMTFRGMINTNGTVGAVLEKKLQPLPFTFTLSGMINHSKNQSRFGCGLAIG